MESKTNNDTIVKLRGEKIKGKIDILDLSHIVMEYNTCIRQV